MLKVLLDKVRSNQKIIISIDGPCGSGKSTMAEEVRRETFCNVLHMDDFYLPFADRDKNWMNMIAGHMDFDRLIEKVLKPYREGRKTEYVLYDCHNDKYLQKIEIDLARPLLIEGSYSSHPCLDEFIDYKVFVDIDSELQKERLVKRNPKVVDKFISMWIPFENNYFEALDIRGRSDLIIQSINS